MEINTSKRLIIKVGSRLLIDEKQQQFNTSWLASLVDDVAGLARTGIKVLLVTSGSVACGNMALKLKRANATLDQQGLKSAQILLTMSDIETRQRYINLRNTLESLLKLNVIPIINENDCIATSEIRYGDNDRLSARVAQMIEADTLILLSDVDGLYTADPSRNKQAEFINQVDKITPEIIAMAAESSTLYGSGGMVTKIQAAKIATLSGCRMLITKGGERHPISHYNKTKKGTWFLAQTTQLNAKKLWLKEHLKPKGYLMLDAGAIKALQSGKSLLPVGITKVEGRFNKGDPVCVINYKREEIARGLTNYNDADLEKIIGKPTGQIKSVLGYLGCNEAIHRNNLVLIG